MGNDSFCTYDATDTGADLDKSEQALSSGEAGDNHKRKECQSMEHLKGNNEEGRVSWVERRNCHGNRAIVLSGLAAAVNFQVACANVLRGKAFHRSIRDGQAAALDAFIGLASSANVEIVLQLL
ncbi:hypothetical protein SASPL_107843 [Salvia splendens]|uniref:Uncharacterized protein n=1 Tax=Salvia splendens TaxID=180675 RepID=A0A8X8YD62_SALSN|nr:hypothetical protein SASPL_107843 [Salvia splendens]